MARKKILVFVDADVIVRHFLDSGAFSDLSSTYDVVLVFPPDNWKRIINSSDINRWRFRACRVEISETRRSLFKKLFFIDQARQRRDPEWRGIRNGWMALVGWKAGLMFSGLSFPLIRQIANAWYKRQLKSMPPKELQMLFDKECPDIILHPSTFEGYFINDLIELTQLRNIPMILLMNSWDNPCLKRNAIGIPDAVVVWGEQTKRHAEKFMGIPPERIHIFGAAQFQIFRDYPTKTKDEVYEINGILPDKLAILYAGSSKGNQEFTHLRLLNVAIDRGLLKGVTVIYRPHPYGVAKEDARAILSGELTHIVIDHSMRGFMLDIANGVNQGFYITPYDETHNLLSAVDAVISPLSTMLIEAGLHGKPVMCFIPEEEDDKSAWRVLRNVIHFKELLQHRNVQVVRTHQEFIPAAQMLISNVENRDKAYDIKDSMKFFVGFTDQPYSTSIKTLVDHHVTIGSFS